MEYAICHIPSPHVSYTYITDDYCEGLEDSESALHHRSMYHCDSGLCCSTYIPKGVLRGESRDSAAATVNLLLGHVPP